MFRVSGIACVVGAVISIIFYVLVKEPGQCLLNKHKRNLERQQSNNAKIINSSTETKQPSQFNIDKGLELSGRSFRLPEKLNDRVVGSTENSDYVPGVFKQTSINDITPYYYPNFYYYSPALKTNQQENNQQSTCSIPSTPVLQSNLVSNLVNNLNERPKLMHSVSIDTTASDLVENGKNLYKKKVGELEKKKSKLSLRNMAVPVKRMFSVDARRQFNCKGMFNCEF